MPKITITVEDLPGNQVKIEATPNFETMMKMDISGERMTSAHRYPGMLVLLDTKAEIFAKYGFVGPPGTFIADRQGNFSFSLKIPNIGESLQ
jgi:hypothetical protein